MISDVEHIVLCLLAICILFGDRSLRVLGQFFFIGLFIFLGGGDLYAHTAQWECTAAPCLPMNQPLSGGDSGVLVVASSCSCWSYLWEGWLGVHSGGPGVWPESLGGAPAWYPLAGKMQTGVLTGSAHRGVLLQLPDCFLSPFPNLPCVVSLSLCYCHCAKAVQWLSEGIALNTGVHLRWTWAKQAQHHSIWTHP